VSNPDSPEVQITENFEVVIPGSTDVTGDLAGKPVYVLFEAVSGRMFMYDESGLIVNYASDGTIISTPTNFIFEIRSLNTGVVKTISVQNIAGKLTIESDDI
jgi:hypothetical protein